MIFPGMAHSLYFLMWLISCISWCGIYIALDICIAFPIMAYILYILMWRTDVASSKLHLLMWRMYYSSEIHSISLYGVHPLFPDVAYFFYFLMWRISHWVSLYDWWMYCSSDIHNISCYGVHPFFLMWPISCNSWCGTHCIVSPDMEYILFFRHQW